ncbi:hypothetical protein RFI_31055, partial [Reticulomyxa filosa]
AKKSMTNEEKAKSSQKLSCLHNVETLKIILNLKKIFFDTKKLIPSLNSKKKKFSILHHWRPIQQKNKSSCKMTAFINHEQTLPQPVVVKKIEIQIIVQNWIRILHIKFGWIHNFDKLVVNYVTFFYFYLNKNKQLYLLFFIIDVNTGKYILY